MSVQIDVKSVDSPSVTRTVDPCPLIATRRITIFERKEIMEGLSTDVIAAIQRELVELREEFDRKCKNLTNRSDRHVTELLRLSASERLDLERLRLDSQGGRWEKESETSSRSASK